MNNKQDPTILLNNIFAFTDPSAKCEEKNIFHLFVVGKNNFGIFLHNGAKYSLDNLQQSSNKIVFYTPTIETNLFGEKIQSKNFHKMHISNNIVDMFTNDFFSINGIEKEALDAIRPIMHDQYITLSSCQRYENLFTCVQKRNRNEKSKQMSLMDFCQ